MKQNQILIAESGSGYGGSAKYVTNLLPLLDRKEFCVEIAAYGNGPFIQKIEEQSGTVHHFPTWRFPWKESMLLGLLQFFWLVPQIAVWLLRRKIKLVHLNNEILSHIPLLLGARLAGIKILCHLHGWRRLTLMEKWASGFVDQFVAVTESGAEFYSRQLNGNSVLGVPNGILRDTKLSDGENGFRMKARKKMGVQDHECLTVIIGRLIPLKGHSVFFQALAKAMTRAPHLKGLVVGRDLSLNDEYRKKLELELQSLGIKEKVQFLPWQDRMELIYEASDVILQPSVRAESFGYVALEGMLAGKPVIASRIGGLVDVVQDGKTGFLVEAGNIDELSHAISKLACHPKLGIELGKQGKARAENVFTMERNASDLTGLYQHLLGSFEDKKKLTPKQALNRAAKHVIHGSGSLSWMRKVSAGKVPILMYHRVSRTPDPFFQAVSFGTFLKQIDYVRHHYQLISLNQLISHWKSGEPVPAQSLAMTFDDGHGPTWSLVYPVLERYKIPVTTFLTSDTLNGNPFIWTDSLRWWLKLTPLNHYAAQLNGAYGEWRLKSVEERLIAAHQILEKLKTLPEEEKKNILGQIEKELKVKPSELPVPWTVSMNDLRKTDRKYIQIGAHTKTHPIMSRLSEDAARAEIFDSKQYLESLWDEKIEHFAYPNGDAGDFNDIHKRLIAEAGFDSACSTVLGLNDSSTDRYALRRVYATEEPTGVFACRLAGIGS